MNPGSLQGVGPATAHGLEARQVRQQATAHGVEARQGRRRGLKPILWLHIQKTGSSLSVILAHYACGTAIPENMTFNQPHEASVDFPAPTGEDVEVECGPWKELRCREARWNYMCGEGSFQRFGSHDPLGKSFPDDDLSHVATMFRDPVQRAISGWHHMKHSCRSATSIKGYADCVNNCQTHMLSGHVCGRRSRATERDYRRAEGRLSKLGFFGLTSEWDLSVCLFHAMHGGTCLPIEFHNTRPGVNHTRSLYNATEYGLNTSQQVGYDDRLWAKAQSIFWSRIEEYNVTRQSCAELYCRDSKEFFQPKLDGAKSAKTSLRHMDYRFEWPGRPAYDED